MAIEWTVETLKAYFDAAIASLKEYFESSRLADRRAIDAAFAAQKSAIDAALAAADRAVLKAETSTEKRFEGVNELRGALSDQQTRLITRDEVSVIVQRFDEKFAAKDKEIAS